MSKVIEKVSKSTMREMNKKAGHDFFNISTMKSFKSKLETNPNKWNLFITSEVYAEVEDPSNDWSARKFNIRFFNTDNGHVEYVRHAECKTIEDARELRDKIVLQLTILKARRGNRLTNADVLDYLEIPRGTNAIPLLPLAPLPGDHSNVSK